MLILTNADIIARMSQLADIHSKAETGTTTTLTNNIYDNDFQNGELNNQYICFLSGANKGIDRLIIDFTASSGTFTFEELDTSVDNTTIYAITKTGFLQYMEEAILFITEVVKNDGKDINLFLTESQLKELHLYKTLDLICQDRFNNATDDDMYFARHQHYQSLFDKTYMKFKADYDEDENGTIEEEEKLTGGSYGVLKR